MSCFMVSDTHIDALVTAALEYDQHDRLPTPDWQALAERFPLTFSPMWKDGQPTRDGFTRGGWKACPTLLGLALILANADSFIARYPATESEPGDGLTRHPDQWGPEGFAGLARYRYTPHKLTPVSLLKQVHVYVYQASEAPTWDSSWARKFCQELENIVIPKLDGYDAAPYGI